MQTTIRTTVRIRKDLFDQSRILAVKENSSLQEIINKTLALGLGKVSDLESTKAAMMKIDKLRMSLLRSKKFTSLRSKKFTSLRSKKFTSLRSKKFTSSDKKINLENLLNKSKSDLK